MGAEAGSAHDLGDERPAAGTGDPLGIRTGVRPGDDERARAPGDPQRLPGCEPRRGSEGGAERIRHRPGQRLARGQVQVHGSGDAVEPLARRAEGHGHGIGGERFEVRRLDLPRHRRVDARTRPGPVHAGLDRGLVRPDAAQLGRPVCRQQDQRHPGVERLHRRGQVSGGGGAGSADECRRHAGSAAEAQGGEAGDPFVDPHVHAHGSGSGERDRGERERLGARAGRQHDVADAVRDEAGQQAHGRLGRGRRRGRQRRRRLTPCGPRRGGRGIREGRRCHGRGPGVSVSPRSSKRDSSSWSSWISRSCSAALIRSAGRPAGSTSSSGR